MLGREIVELANNLFHVQGMPWAKAAFYRENPSFDYEKGGPSPTRREGSCLLGAVLEHMGISKEMLTKTSGVTQFCPEMIIKEGVDPHAIINCVEKRHRITINQGKQLRLLESINDTNISLEGVLERLITNYSETDFPTEALFIVFQRMQKEEEHIRKLNSISFADAHVEGVDKAIEQQGNTPIEIGFEAKEVDVVHNTSKQAEPALV